MCLDILEREEIVTYREKEQDLLMEIKAGKYPDSNEQPIPQRPLCRRSLIIKRYMSCRRR